MLLDPTPNPKCHDTLQRWGALSARAFAAKEQKMKHPLVDQRDARILEAIRDDRLVIAPDHLSGRCEEAPRANVFSFDHVLRIGFTLRRSVESTDPHSLGRGDAHHSSECGGAPSSGGSRP